MKGSNMAFRMVMGLWVTPDFADVMAGRSAPPFVNHALLDYPAIASAIGELFHYGPPVTIQVPNDTIDQVTLHYRSTSANPESMRCSDFGELLLAAAKSQKTEVVDIRAKWSALHQLKNRDKVPPPAMLPFVVTGTDFEDVILWKSSTRPCLGLKPLGIPAGLSNEGSSEVEHKGHLPKEALAKFKALFGTPYESHALLSTLYADDYPDYVASQGFD